MATVISAKELRENLSQYLQRAMHGEDIEVIYRSKPAVKLQALRPEGLGAPKGSSAAFKLAMDRVGTKLAVHSSNLDPNKSVKELYHELLDDDPKYQSKGL